MRLTSTGYKHIHVLRSTTYRRADSKNEDECKKNWFAAEPGDEVPDEGDDCGRRDGERAPDPNEVRTVQVIDDCGEGRRYSHLECHVSIARRSGGLTEDRTYDVEDR